MAGDVMLQNVVIRNRFKRPYMPLVFNFFFYSEQVVTTPNIQGYEYSQITDALKWPTFQTVS